MIDFQVDSAVICSTNTSRRAEVLSPVPDRARQQLSVRVDIILNNNLLANSSLESGTETGA